MFRLCPQSFKRLASRHGCLSLQKELKAVKTMGFLEIECLCLFTGQVKSKPKGSFLLGPAMLSSSLLTHPRLRRTPSCSAEKWLTRHRLGIDLAFSWRRTLSMLPEEDGEKLPSLLGEEGGRERVDQTRMECLQFPFALAWSKRDREQCELVQTWTLSSTQPQRQRCHGLFFCGSLG